MVYKFVIIAFLQAIAIQSAYGQAINRILQAGLPGVLPVTETFVNPSMVLNSLGASVIPTAAGTIINNPCGAETIIPNQLTLPGTTTIVQDSSVANNLANALQLLVVSNLLSNTLPGVNDVIVPGYPGLDLYGGNLVAPVVSPYAMPSCGCGANLGYSYVF